MSFNTSIEINLPLYIKFNNIFNTPCAKIIQQKKFDFNFECTQF